MNGELDDAETNVGDATSGGTDAAASAISALHARLAEIDALELDDRIDSLEELNRQIVSQLSALEEW